MPIRTADLVKLMEDSELIAVARFDPQKLPAGAGTTWKAQVIHGPESEFKGKAGKDLGDQIAIKGDPKDFLPLDRPELDVKKQGFGFVPDRACDFVLFLKSADEPGTYQCLEACPGGMRFYEALGRGIMDHRRLFVGMVGGRLAVEGGPGHERHCMTGPTVMLNALRALKTGTTLTAKATGGAAVDVELAVGGASLVPGQLVLAAAVLWAEVETPEGDGVLLSPADYKLPEKESPYVEAKTVAGGKVAGRVELPTGPVPEGAELVWARANHRKALLGSLPEGEHTVRLFSLVNNADARKAVLVISNPVTVRGKAGGATPADLAKVKEPEVEAKSAGPAKPAAKGAIDKSALKGEIWFDSNRDGSWDVFVMNADGTNIRNVTNSKDKDEFEPRPSPDGKRVVYVVGKLRNGGVWGGRWNEGQIWVCERDGGNAKKVADGSRPVWGPDGKAIVYNGKVQDLETGRITNPFKNNKWFREVGGFDFATETRRMAFNGKLWTQADSAIYAADLDENYEVRSFKPVHTSYHGCTPRWSADGQRMYFAHHDTACYGDIILWSIKADGSDARRFATPARGAWPGYDPFCESPDGTMFAYLSGAGISVQRISDGADLAITEKGKAQYGGVRWHKGIEGK
jgi:TolB protein